MTLPPLQFSSLRIGEPLLLAPMAGYTDAAFRSVCKEHGAGGCYTEVTSAEGIRHDSQKTFQFLETSSMDRPIAAHLFGKSVEAMVEAARYVEQLGRFDWIDLNCGCPVRKVVRRGAGAALMKDPVEIGRMVRAVKNAVRLPVTVKTRIGFSPAFPDHLAIARQVQDGGADMIAVHGRYACDFHKGEVDWNKIGEIKQSLSIPVLGNGGIFEPGDALEAVRRSGVDGLLIGRGAVGSPWLFGQISTHLRGESPYTPMLDDLRRVIKTHLHRLVDLTVASVAGRRRKSGFCPETAACLHFRPHLAQYLKGLRGRRGLMQQLNELLTVDQVLSAVDIVMEQNQEESDA